MCCRHLPVLLLALLAGSAGVAATFANEVPPAGLPRYEPVTLPPGVIRHYGADLGGLVLRWERGFRRYQPGITFSDQFPSSDAAIAGIITGIADIATNGREPVLTEVLGFNETFGYPMTEIAVASGSYDVKGRSWGIVFFVNRHNPIPGLTLGQADGIFGAARTGGYQGEKWLPQRGRSSALDIRHWGELGLPEPWAKQEIQTYGYAFTGMSNFFQQQVFSGGDKWNPNYREYVESGTKMVPAGAGGRAVSIDSMLAELSANPNGIAWTGIAQAHAFAQVRALPLAAGPGQPWVAPTREHFLDRTYPLVRSVFFQINRAPGRPVDPRLAEYLRYILSAEGQQMVAAQGEYLPLPPAAAAQELQKLN